MPEESNLQEVLDAVESLKKENNSIIEYIKSNDKTIKSNQKLLDLLSDKPDVYDRNESLSDNIDELNKTLKGLPKSLKVEGDGKSFNFLDLLPVLAGVLALSYLKGSSDDSKGNGKSPLENDIDSFNEGLKNLVSEKAVRTLGVEPISKYIGRKVDKMAGRAAGKIALEQRNKVNAVKKSTASELRESEDAVIAAKDAENKAWQKHAENLEKNPLDIEGREALEGAANRASGKTEALESRLAEQTAKANEKIADAAALTVGKRIVSVGAKSLLFVDKFARAYFLKQRMDEKDYVGAGLEATGLGLSSLRDLALVTGVGAPVAGLLEGGVIAVDSYTTYRDLKSFLPTYNEKINDNKTFKESIRNNFNTGSKGTANHCINFFRNKGFTLKAACGIAGNAWVESKFNHNAWEKQTKQRHYGVFQWDKSRRESFSKVFHKHITESTLEEQYNYAIWELEHYIKKGITNGNYTINLKETPEEAAKWWADFFEVCQGQMMQQRIQMARKFYDDYQKSYNISKVESKLSKNSSKVPNPTSIKLINASKAEQQKFNQKFKNIINSGKPTSKTSQNTNQNLVSVSSPTYNSSNYFGEITPDIQDQSWYNYQKRTGVTDAFKGAYTT